MINKRRGGGTKLPLRLNLEATVKRSMLCFIFCLLLAACGPAATPQPEPTSPPPTATATPQPTPTPTKVPGPFPLADPGPYAVGQRAIAASDPSRGGRPVNITLWYPAVQADTDAKPDRGGRPANITLWYPVVQPAIDAEPDRGGAPYPLILSSTKIANLLAPIVVTHGFAWASVDGIDSYFSMSTEMINQPLDILFALEQVASNPPEGLQGLMDADRAGVTGYSFDGFNTYALSGARVDENYYRAQCPDRDAVTAEVVSKYSVLGCWPLREWEKFTAPAAGYIAAGQDGLWAPMTDERIRAVMPLAGEGWWWFGARGLAAVDRPVLILGGTDDDLYRENALMFESLGTPEKAMISFIGQDHMAMVEQPERIAEMAHFVAAFFGVHLKGRADLAQYCSQKFVARHASLAWGVYAGE